MDEIVFAGNSSDGFSGGEPVDISDEQCCWSAIAAWTDRSAADDHHRNELGVGRADAGAAGGSATVPGDAAAADSPSAGAERAAEPAGWSAGERGRASEPAAVRVAPPAAVREQQVALVRCWRRRSRNHRRRQTWTGAGCWTGDHSSAAAGGRVGAQPAESATASARTAESAAAERVRTSSSPAGSNGSGMQL